VSGFGINTAVADWFGVPGGYLVGENEGQHENVYEGAELETEWVQNHQSLKNSLLICEFASSPELFFHPPEMDIRTFESRLLSAVTGIDVNVNELWRAGERIWNLRRAIMVLRENRGRDDDTLCPDLFEEVVKVQQPEVLSEPLDRLQWELLKDSYYHLRGWDLDSGRPKREKLESLGMKDVADKLEGAGKLD
jgi:aldehyde:ferredoxin oxidoreductase